MLLHGFHVSKSLNFKFMLLFSQAGADPGFVGPEAYTVLGGPSVGKIIQN
jgi:hypothetical protein